MATKTGKVIERRALYAATLRDAGVNLQEDYFALSLDKLQKVCEYCKVFKFKSSNPSRTDAQQFYYSAQEGAKYLL